MTEYVVPMGTPQFFAGTVPVVDPTRYNWVGAYPYLDTADTDTSYGEVNMVGLGSGFDKYAGSTLPAYIAPAGITSARVDLQIYVTAGSGSWSGGFYWLDCDDVAAPWSRYNSFFSLGVGWNTFADTWSYDLPGLLAALATGNMRFSASRAQQDVVFRVSQLRLTLIGAGIPINQQLQRRDGLGRGGVPLARGQATRQTSNQGRAPY